MKYYFWCLLLVAATFDPVTVKLFDTGEWSVSNPSFSGNPFDLDANVSFVHESGVVIVTQMFYDGGDVWRFRFTPTLLGEWVFSSVSSDPELDGLSGSVTAVENPAEPYGFVTSYDAGTHSKWVRPKGNSQVLEPFVPQFVMYKDPSVFYNNPLMVDEDLDLFFDEHGFNGLHVFVACRWYDLSTDKCTQVANTDPDIATFEALEMLIQKVHDRGGVVHIWLYGDSSRRQNSESLPGGQNGPEDQRMQRYLAARLGPLPGWTLGYGFDLFEFCTEQELDAFYDYMHEHLGWPHLLGARSHKNKLTQISEKMDYSSYEQHRPDYPKYVESIRERPYKPTFSEDRFRVRNSDNHAYKDYNESLTRRGLYHSFMVGGVANIWGYLIGSPGYWSVEYPFKDVIKTYSLFVKDRFELDFDICNELTNDGVYHEDVTKGVCLGNNNRRLFYVEDADSLSVDLRSFSSPVSITAVDTKLPYQELSLGSYSPSKITLSLPYSSDWALDVKPSCSDCLSSQVISLSSGWNDVGLYVDPGVSDASLLFSDPAIRVVRDDTGGVFYPVFSIDSLAPWSPARSYQVYSSADATLTFNGPLLSKQSSLLPAGWSRIVYLGDDTTLDAALSDLSSLVVALVKNGIYYPEFGILDAPIIRQGDVIKLYLSNPELY